jgi:hypothetical protein
MTKRPPETPYVTLLRDPRWQKKRLEILTRDKWHCVWCHDYESPLQVHHKLYERSRSPWDYPGTNFITLCDRCHERVTKLRKRATFLLSELNLYELPLAVETLEKFWSGNDDNLKAIAGEAPVVVKQPAEPSSFPMPAARIAGAVLASVERLEVEKTEILALDWTSERSRRVDVIDFEIGLMWDRLAATIDVVA